MYFREYVRVAASIQKSPRCGPATCLHGNSTVSTLVENGRRDARHPRGARPRCHHCKLTWREKARRAGMGISAAIKKAVTLLMDVRATLAPVRLRHSPVLS